MLLAAVKLASPLIAALLLFAGSMTNAFGSQQLTMTNVAGAAGDCTTAASGGVCATLFPAGALLAPGRTLSRQVTIGYHGGAPTHEFGVYATDYVSRAAASAAFCTAADPAAKLNLAISEAGRPLYNGTLAAFAESHSSPETLLMVGGGRWTNGETATFDFSVSLDESADNSYMGCVSRAGLAWYAA